MEKPLKIRFVFKIEGLIEKLTQYLELLPNDVETKPMFACVITLSLEKARKLLDVEKVYIGKNGNYEYNHEFHLPAEIREQVKFTYILQSPLLLYSSLPLEIENYHIYLSELKDLFDISDLHTKGITGSRIKIGMLDTGLDINHPYYQQNQHLIHAVNDGAFLDYEGHGTGETANIVEIAPEAEILVSNIRGDVAGALIELIMLNPRIVNISWGYDIDEMNLEELQLRSRQMSSLVGELSFLINRFKEDTVFVAAAGNGHNCFPASHPEVVSVGGIYKNELGITRVSDGYSTSFKSKLFPGVTVPDVYGFVGDYIDEKEVGHIVLPSPLGVRIGCCCLEKDQANQGWALFSGTSASSPQLAGIFSLILSTNESMSSTSLLEIFWSSLDWEVDDAGSRYSKINVLRAIENASLLK